MSSSTAWFDSLSEGWSPHSGLTDAALPYASLSNAWADGPAMLLVWLAARFTGDAPARRFTLATAAQCVDRVLRCVEPSELGLDSDALDQALFARILAPLTHSESPEPEAAERYGAAAATLVAYHRAAPELLRAARAIDAIDQSERRLSGDFRARMEPRMGSAAVDALLARGSTPHQATFANALYSAMAAAQAAVGHYCGLLDVPRTRIDVTDPIRRRHALDDEGRTIVTTGALDR